MGVNRTPPIAVLVVARSYPPPTARITSILSPSLSTRSACRARLTTSPFTAAATASGRNSNRITSALRSVPSGTSRASPLMAVVSQALLRRAHEPGRVAVQEIMLCNAAIRNLIRENKLFQIPSMMQAGKAVGQQLMEVHAKELALAKKISREDAIRLTNNPKLFDDVMPAGGVRPPLGQGMR